MAPAITRRSRSRPFSTVLSMARPRKRGMNMAVADAPDNARNAPAMYLL